MIKKNFRSMAAILLVLLLSLSFSACGGSSGSQGEEKNTTGTETSTTPAKETEAVPAPKENVNLVIWYSTSSSEVSKVRTDFIEKYQKDNPNVKISDVPQPNDNYNDLFKAANLAGNGPDIIELWPGATTTDYKASLLPLNKYLTEDFINKRFGWNLAIPGFTNTGDILGIPRGAYVYCIWYNKELMSKAGFDEANPPKTWDELLSLCEALKQKSITPFCIGSKDGYMAQWGVGAVLCTLLGNDIDKLLKNKFEGSELEKAIEIWQQLGKKGYLNKDTLSISTGDEQDRRFGNGAGAMLLSGNWEYNVLHDFMGDKLGFMKFPAADPNNPNKDYNYAGPIINMCVTSYSKYPDEAVKFIMEFNSEDNTIALSNEMKELPTVSAIDENKLTDPVLKEFYKIMKSGQNSVLIDLVPLNAYNELVRVGGLLNVGKITPKDVCKLMDEQVK